MCVHLENVWMWAPEDLDVLGEDVPLVKGEASVAKQDDNCLLTSLKVVSISPLH